MCAEFAVRLNGVSFDTDDGTSRQDLLKGLRPGHPVQLVRDPDNPHDRFAVGVWTPDRNQIGWLPREDSRVAVELDRGVDYEAVVKDVDGGKSLIDKLLFRAGKHLGCVILVQLGSYDWAKVEPWRRLDQEINELLSEGYKTEKDDRAHALSCCRQAARKMSELDTQGAQARAWRTARHPVNRISLILERQKEFDAALDEIESWRRQDVRIGIARQDRDAVDKREKRLREKVQGS